MRSPRRSTLPTASGSRGQEGGTFTPEEVIGLLRLGKVAELSLDHDHDHDLGLNDGVSERTGYIVLLWLEAEVGTRTLVSSAAGDLGSQRQPGRARTDGASHPHDLPAPREGIGRGRDTSPTRGDLDTFSRARDTRAQSSAVSGRSEIRAAVPASSWPAPSPMPRQPPRVPPRSSTQARARSHIARVCL